MSLLHSKRLRACPHKWRSHWRRQSHTCCLCTSQGGLKSAQHHTITLRPQSGSRECVLVLLAGGVCCLSLDDMPFRDAADRLATLRCICDVLLARGMRGIVVAEWQVEAGLLAGLPLCSVSSTTTNTTTAATAATPALPVTPTLTAETPPSASSPTATEPTVTQQKKKKQHVLWWQHLDSSALPWVASKCCCCVHAGTSTQVGIAMSVGTPQIIFPAYSEHTFWATTLAHLKVAPR